MCGTSHRPFGPQRLWGPWPGWSRLRVSQMSLDRLTEGCRYGGANNLPIWDIEFLVILGQAEPTPVGAKLKWSAQLCKLTASMPCRPATEHFEPQRCNHQTIKAFRHDVSVVMYQLGCSSRDKRLHIRQYLAQLPPLAQAYSCTPSRVSPLKFAQTLCALCMLKGLWAFCTPVTLMASYATA